MKQTSNVKRSFSAVTVQKRTTERLKSPIPVVFQCAKGVFLPPRDMTFSAVTLQNRFISQLGCKGQ